MITRFHLVFVLISFLPLEAMEMRQEGLERSVKGSFFGYRVVPAQSAMDCRYLPRSTYATFSSQGKHWGLIGPLARSLAIILSYHDPETKEVRTIAFHKDPSNKIEPLLTLTRDYLKVESPTNAKGVIFSNKQTGYGRGQTENSEQINQTEEIKAVKNQLIELFGNIPRLQIKAGLYVKGEQRAGAGSAACYAHLFLGVDPYGEVFHTCPLQINYFGVRQENVCLFMEFIRKNIQNREGYREAQQDSLESYDVVPFSEMKAPALQLKEIYSQFVVSPFVLPEITEDQIEAGKWSAGMIATFYS
jgi:hypothetical protein